MHQKNNHTKTYARANISYQKPYHAFTPKRPVRSFRDLDVYTKTLEYAIDVTNKFFIPRAFEKFPLREQMTHGALAIPLLIAEAHSMRFGDHTLAIQLLEKAMAGCNKTIVYLETLRGMYGAKADNDAIEGLVQGYIGIRGKIFRLEKAWQKWDTERESHK